MGYVRRDEDGKINFWCASPFTDLITGEEVNELIEPGGLEEMNYLYPPPSADYILPKALPWRRMTEAEATTVTAAMSQATARQRAIYDAAQEIDTTDELYGILIGLLSSALSPTRATQLLARQ